VEPGDLTRLNRLVDSLEWSDPPPYGVGQHVHQGYRRNKGSVLPGWVTEGLVGPTSGCWVSWIEPAGFIVPHKDAGKPYTKRMQVCVRPSGAMWDPDRGWFTVEPGETFEVFHWLPHAVQVGDVPRVHVVLDLLEPAGVPDGGFELFGWDVVPDGRPVQ